MWWNLRTVRTLVKGQNVFSLHRCFYSEESKKTLTYIENEPMNLTGVGHLPMLQDIDEALDAFERPTLYIPEWNCE